MDALAQSPTSLQGWRPSFRVTLFAFGAAILVPVVIFASVLLWRFADSAATRYEEEARAAARRFVAAVDLELSRVQAAAEALATSTHLQAGHFEAFQQQAQNGLKIWSPAGSDKMAVVVRDLAGQQVVNTRLPWGATLPRSAYPELDQAVARSKQPLIQDLFVDATAKQLILAVRAPVLHEGAVTHVLSVELEPGHFTTLAKAQSVPTDWVIAILDRSHHVIARSRDAEQFVGTSAPDDFRSKATGQGGVWVGPNLNGVPVLGAYERSALSGWTAFVGVPWATVQQPLWRSLWLISALGVLALGLSVLLALFLGQRISRSVRTLAQSARALGRGEPVQPIRLGLREADEVGQALATASSLLRQREADLRASEGRLRATHENAGVGIVQVDREGRFLYVNEAQTRLTGHTREQLLGRHFAHATHPDDLDRDYELFRRQVAGEFEIYTLEKRHVRVDGTTGWARVSSTAVRDGNGDFLYAVRVVEDISERKNAEARQKLLVDELNHRVKNTLMTVQSLAFQTFRQGLPSEVARERFEARLISLSRTHNLLNESHWQGARLKDVLTLELAPYIGDSQDRLIASGPDLDLPARTAVVLGMVFHELATNAVKYGCFSVPQGCLDVRWRLTPVEADPETLSIEWVERNGPPAMQPRRSGFGCRLIQQATVRELGGRADLRYGADGLNVSLDIPLETCASRREVPKAA